MTDKIRHRLSKSEVRYGRIFGTKTDGMYEFLASMPEYFKIKIQNRVLAQKRFKAGKIYISEEIMALFEIGNIIEITKTDDGLLTVELVDDSIPS